MILFFFGLALPMTYDYSVSKRAVIDRTASGWKLCIYNGATVKPSEEFFFSADEMGHLEMAFSYLLHDLAIHLGPNLPESYEPMITYTSVLCDHKASH